MREHVKAAARGRDAGGGGSGGTSNGGGASAAASSSSSAAAAAATGPAEGCVVGLAWVMSSSAVLAVLLSPGLLLLWDTKGGAGRGRVR